MIMEQGIIPIDSLEIFRTNRYIPTKIGMVSDNAYVSIVATNNCQFNCPYCINSSTDRSKNLPIGKAYDNIQSIVDKYGVKEGIILGGEPLLHPDILGLIRRLRTITGLKMMRLTTNGYYLKQHPEIIPQLVDKRWGIQGINISHHGKDSFMNYSELGYICRLIKEANPEIKIRINSNIWKNNLDTFDSLVSHIRRATEYADEIRVSNIIPKDDFSVNPINHGEDLILTDNEYIELFESLYQHYLDLGFSIIENKETFGFVKYLLIPTRKPIIINWNIGSMVSDQVCENDIEHRKINTFKCLVDGSISLSWNQNNIIKN